MAYSDGIKHGMLYPYGDHWEQSSFARNMAEGMRRKGEDGLRAFYLGLARGLREER